jgi:hypothetical protein
LFAANEVARIFNPSIQRHNSIKIIQAENID